MTFATPPNKNGGRLPRSSASETPGHLAAELGMPSIPRKTNGWNAKKMMVWNMSFLKKWDDFLGSMLILKGCRISFFFVRSI